MKVFNISHHKCGTSSMHQAFHILGFKSYHWATCGVWWEPYLKNLAMDPALGEDNTAFGDLPIPMMYRDLHRLYPQARFVFVLRDRMEWVGSLRKHLAKGWLEPHPVHTMFYGYQITSATMDDEVCLRAYDRFCEDVLRFFSGRENFLVMRLEGIGWEPLCRFLGKDIPKEPFPELHKS